MNFYAFHIGDYTSHTAHLTPIEDIVYRRLIDLYYLREGALPADFSECARLIRMRDQAEIVAQILREFFDQGEDGAWNSSRCEVEIAAASVKRDKARASAASRWDAMRDKTQQHTERNANAMRTHSEGNASAECDGNAPNPIPNPIPIPKERESARGSRLPTDFALPDEWIAFCEAERKDLNPYEAGKRFADYWHGVAGAKGRKADWLATWRNWVRNEKAQGSAAMPRESFKERDTRLAREQYEKAIGRRSTPAYRDAIDVTPGVPFLEIEQ